MDFLNYLKSVNDTYLQIALTLALILVYVILAKITSSVVKKFGKRHELTARRVVYTTKYFRFLAFTLCLALLGLVWDISFKGLSVYFLSFFTVAGIGLFASWSILSNITAAIILFFYFPYRIGSKIRIVDGDNSVEGEVYDLSLFAVIIKNNENQKVSYPNNMILQKAIIILKE